MSDTSTHYDADVTGFCNLSTTLFGTDWFPIIDPTARPYRLAQWESNYGFSVMAAGDGAYRFIGRATFALGPLVFRNIANPKRVILTPFDEVICGDLPRPNTNPQCYHFTTLAKLFQDFPELDT